MSVEAVEYSFIVPGKPVPKGRPRMTRSGRAYTPKRTHDAELHVAAVYQGPMFDGPVELDLQFHPDHTLVTIREVDGTSKLRGDLDNYAKLVGDGLNKIAYADDRQVMSIRASKH